MIDDFGERVADGVGLRLRVADIGVLTAGMVVEQPARAGEVDEPSAVQPRPLGAQDDNRSPSTRVMLAA